MVKRWMASAPRATEKNFRKVMGYRELWALEAILKWIEVCHPTEGGLVRMAPTAATNFQRD
jgi:hypothetical protein